MSNDKDLQLFLASGSPRRRELLDQLGLRYRVVVPDVDESQSPGETAAEYVLRVACEKAVAGRRLTGMPAIPVLGADTAVVVDGDVLGKPNGVAAAARMLKRLSGRTHEVFSAVALECPGNGCGQRLSKTEVQFKPLSSGEIEAYCQTGEPLDKAGAYGIQGLAAVFIENINGSYSGVVGLPLLETVELLSLAGVRLY